MRLPLWRVVPFVLCETVCHPPWMQGADGAEPDCVVPGGELVGSAPDKDARDQLDRPGPSAAPPG